MKAQQHLILIFTAWFCICLAPGFAAAAAYDLVAVKGIAAFGGSGEAKEILARNGFVVADPAFKQIFEPYIKSPQVKEPSEKHPMGESLPSFITTDSAWHTYHVLLEEGVKDLEEVQSQRLLRFSRRLWAVAKEQQTNSNAADLMADCSSPSSRMTRTNTVSSAGVSWPSISPARQASMFRLAALWT